MFARCSEEFMYAVNSPSGSPLEPSPTFSATTFASAEPWCCTSYTKLGLWLSDRCEAMCAVHEDATEEMPDATRSVGSPCCARALLTSCSSRELYDDGLYVDADATDVRLAAITSNARKERTRMVTGTRALVRTVAVMPSQLGADDSLLN